MSSPVTRICSTYTGAEDSFILTSAAFLELLDERRDSGPES